MSSLSINAENVSKMYRLGAALDGHRSLASQLRHLAGAPLRHLRYWRETPPEEDTLWALRDVSFQVHEGEVVGIIGNNGAGKSTLLKILTRITEPTSGRIEFRGRVASLLEVGTGFHVELTGRENVFLNGALLGMSRREILRKFDEIVEFAGVKRFLDTPVKRYSSGMKVRLAFAVAAHLEPEILLIDEVLAVGDTEFQRRCLGKMDEVARAGRTIVFVSHQMAAVKSLCERVYLLEAGRVKAEGPTEEVVTQYVVQYAKAAAAADLHRIAADRGDATLINEQPQFGEYYINCGSPLVLEFQIELPDEIPSASVGVTLYNSESSPVVAMSTKVQGIASSPGPAKTWRVRCDLGCVPLNAGTYFTRVYVADGNHDIARFSNAQIIQFNEHDVFGWGNGLPAAEHWGHFYWAPDWQVDPAT
jgi:lipopolysaccharide transport system ATP-binding protein